MRTFIPVFTSLVLLGCTLGVSAQGMRRDSMQRFEQADTNHDGRISLQEFQAERADRFRKMDRNGDGYITDDDIPSFLRGNGRLMKADHAMQQMADVNHDGRVSRDEYMAAGEDLFHTVDTDHDGFVDKDEMQQATQRIQAMAKNR